MKKWLLSIFILVVITGCAVKPQRIVVTEEKLVYVPIPEKYLTPCKTTKPINRQEYNSIDDTSEKETLLTSNIISLHKDIFTCNKQIESIKEFNGKQIQLVEEHNRKKK